MEFLFFEEFEIALRDGDSCHSCFLRIVFFTFSTIRLYFFEFITVHHDEENLLKWEIVIYYLIYVFNEIITYEYITRVVYSHSKRKCVLIK